MKSIISSNNVGTVSWIHICNCNMNIGAWTTCSLSWLRHDKKSCIVHPPTVHAAAADVDATYGAFVAAEDSTLNDIHNDGKNANQRNNIVNYGSAKYIFGQ